MVSLIMFYIIGRMLRPCSLYWIAWWGGVIWRAVQLFVGVYKAGKHEKLP